MGDIAFPAGETRYEFDKGVVSERIPSEEEQKAIEEILYANSSQPKTDLIIALIGFVKRVAEKESPYDYELEAMVASSKTLVELLRKDWSL